MKTINARLCVLLLAALTMINSNAQPAGSGPGWEGEIRALETQEREAVLRGDTAALEGLWAETMIVNNPQGTISADRSVVLSLVRNGTIRYAAFERSIEAVRFDGDLAIVMGSEAVTPVKGSPHGTETIQRRFTNIWKRKGDAWTMIARHANVIPPK